MSFIEFARQHGLTIDPSRFYPAERIFRCATVSKPRSDNGAYFWDGERGWVMDWAENPKPIWYNSPYAVPFTEKEKHDWFQKRKNADEERKAGWAKAAKYAEEQFKEARLDHHPYLISKGFPDETGLVVNETLLIPMRNFSTNKVQGYQQIFFDNGWQKKMLKGMRAKQSVMQLGAGGEIWLTEGYATALSVRAALRQAQVPSTVVCCFSANNLVDIASNLVKSNKLQTFVFADHDKAGIEAGENSFFPFTYADTEGWDANDLHQKEGLLAVTQKIIDLRSGYL